MTNSKSGAASFVYDALFVIGAWLLVGGIFRLVGRVIPVGLLLFAVLFIYLPVSWLFRSWQRHRQAQFWSARACPACGERFQIRSTQNDSNVTPWAIQNAEGRLLRGISLRCEECGQTTDFTNHGTHVDLKAL